MPYGTVSADLIVGTNGGRISPENTFGFRNRLINGSMTIDQRNAGASVGTASGITTYTVDRWRVVYSQQNKFTVQQNAGSVTPPVGFVNYLGCTSSSNYAVGASEIFVLQQLIEGLNIADLGWGTANAKTVTLSFQVYSSLTGTFGGSLKNSAENRSYPFSFLIPVANTWTTISITVAGDTTGTWLTTNGVGLTVTFSLGSGTTVSGTAGSWSANNYSSATGATSVVGTNGATFYITGVQLEVGSNATSFEYRPYGTELALCQRYFQTFTKPNLIGACGIPPSLNRLSKNLLVTMRTAPTLAVNGTFDWFDGTVIGTFTTILVQYSTISSIEIDTNAVTGATTTNRAALTYVGPNTGTITASSEL
jgi:hypothetical protein